MAQLQVRIGIVGGGGTGSPMAMLLMRLGARHLALIDPDVIEDTNLNRVHGSRRADAEVAFSPGFRWGVSILPGQPITLEDVYTHTALTYANTWAREMTGSEIVRIMEDVADNQPAGCLAPADFFLSVGFKTVRQHPRYPRLRLELRTALSWKSDVEYALEKLLGSMSPEALLRPVRPATRSTLS